MKTTNVTRINPFAPELPLVAELKLAYLTDAEIESFARQNPGLMAAIREMESQPIAYDNGIEPDAALLRVG
jgi:hypothetical protein